MCAREQDSKRINPNIEIPNPKQIKKFEILMIKTNKKTKPHLRNQSFQSLFWSFELLISNLFRISIFGFRISEILASHDETQHQYEQARASPATHPTLVPRRPCVRWLTGLTTTPDSLTTRSVEPGA